LFIVDYDKAANIAKILIDLRQNNPEYKPEKIMPEYQLPRNINEGSRELALYYTYIIALDYMTDADKLWQQARGTYEQHPEMFTPEKILEIDEKELAVFLKNLGARYYIKAARAWKEISTILLRDYGGDPRNITIEPLTIKEIKEKHLEKFPYLRGDKLSNFYLRVMGEKKLLKIMDFNDLDVAVDIHVARFTIYTGVLKPKTPVTEVVLNNQLKELVKEAWRRGAKKISMAPWMLDEAIWYIGKNLCREKKCSGCPIAIYCDKNIGIKVKSRQNKKKLK